MNRYEREKQAVEALVELCLGNKERSDNTHVIRGQIIRIEITRLSTLGQVEEAVNERI